VNCIDVTYSRTLVCTGGGEEGPWTLAILFIEDPTALQYWSEL